MGILAFILGFRAKPYASHKGESEGGDAVTDQHSSRSFVPSWPNLQSILKRIIRDILIILLMFGQAIRVAADHCDTGQEVTL